MKRILLTNDDGVHADGILRLAKAASAFGEVWVVAPYRQRSGISHGLTLHGSFEAWEVAFPIPHIRAFACTGTPADCVRIGVLNLLPEKPNAVFSGINCGFNVGTDLQYSATVGAAFEGAFQKIPSIAFSEGTGDCHAVADRYLSEILEKLLNRPLDARRIWNVNFPDCPLSECKGILWNRTVSEHDFYMDTYAETAMPSGRISYTVVGKRNWNACEGTDLRAILDHYVSIGVATNIS